VRVTFASPTDLSDGVGVDCVYVPTEQSWERRDVTDAIRYYKLLRKILP
jgi:hypothetical protein